MKKKIEIQNEYLLGSDVEREVPIEANRVEGESEEAPFLDPRPLLLLLLRTLHNC